MSDELIEGRDIRNRPVEPVQAPPPAPEGRKSRLKGKIQPRAEDEKSGPYITLVPPDEAGDPIRAQADEPTFHKGMKPVVADETPAEAAPEQHDSSAPAPDLPWAVFEAAPTPAAEPEPPPPPRAPSARVSKTDSLMRLPRVPAEDAPAPEPEPEPEPALPGSVDFIPHFHTPTGELPAVPEEIAPEPEGEPAPEAEPAEQDTSEFIPHFHTPTGAFPPVPEDVAPEPAAEPEPEIEAEAEPGLPGAIEPIVDQDIPRIRRAEDSLTPGILRRVPADEESQPELPPIRRGVRRRAPVEEDEEVGKQRSSPPRAVLEEDDKAVDRGKSVALEDDIAGGLPTLRRMVDEVTGEVIDADWVREVGDGEPPLREPKRPRGGGIEQKIAEKLEARRAQAQRRPAIKLNTRTILTIISIAALIALIIYIPLRLGLFGGPSGQPTPTVPAANPTAPVGEGPTTEPGKPTPVIGALPYQQGRIAFASNRDGNYEIYVMDLAANTISRMTNNNAADRAPAWSPDGTKIAYVSNSSGNDDLYVIPATGGTPIQLTTDPGSDRNPAWSPDGAQIVSTRENVAGSSLVSTPTVCIAQPGTCESQIKLLTPGGYDRFPAWSPNGKKLAFTASDLPGGASVIAILNPDGSGYQSFPGTKTSDLSPAWSPDGTKIAFLSYAEGDYDLWVMYSDGTGVTQTTKSQAADGAPAWSPDGRYIVFASDRDDKQHFNLYLLQTDCLASGTNCEDSLIRLTNQAADDLDPTWIR